MGLAQGRSINICDGILEQGSISDGTPVSYTTRVRTVNFIPVNSGSSYPINLKGANSVIVVTYDKNKNWVSQTGWTNLPYTPIIGAGRYYMKLVFKIDDTTSISPNSISEIMVNEGSTRLAYEPYQEPKKIKELVRGMSKNLLTKQGLSTPKTDTDFWNDINSAVTPLSDGYFNMKYTNNTSSSTYQRLFVNHSVVNLKPNTQYTIFTEITKVQKTSGTGNLRFYVTDVNVSDPFNVTTGQNYSTTGTFKKLVTTKSDFSGTVGLRLLTEVGANTSGEIEARVMLLEGDYTNVDIAYEPYQEPKKIKELVRGMSKNLTNTDTLKSIVVPALIINSRESFTLDLSRGGMGTISNYDLFFNDLNPNEQYTISYDFIQNNSIFLPALRFFYTDGTNTYVNVPNNINEVVHIKTTSALGKTIDKITMAWSTTSTGGIATFSKIQLEKGTIATEYEPYIEPKVIFRDTEEVM